MKRKSLCFILVLVLCISVFSVALASSRQAGGRCYMNNSGRSVSFSGYSSSAQTEDSIGVTVILWEQRGSSWYEVARVSNRLTNTNYVDAFSSKTVDGGHYYKVSATHSSSKGGVTYSGTSETAMKWIP